MIRGQRWLWRRGGVRSINYYGLFIFYSGLLVGLACLRCRGYAPLVWFLCSCYEDFGAKAPIAISCKRGLIRRQSSDPDDYRDYRMRGIV